MKSILVVILFFVLSCERENNDINQIKITDKLLPNTISNSTDKSNNSHKKTVISQYIGLELMCEKSDKYCMGENEIWLHKNTLTVENDSLYLKKSPMYIDKLGDTISSASDGGFHRYKGVKIKDQFIFEKTACSYCGVKKSKKNKYGYFSPASLIDTFKVVESPNQIVLTSGNKKIIYSRVESTPIKKDYYNNFDRMAYFKNKFLDEEIIDSLVSKLDLHLNHEKIFFKNTIGQFKVFNNFDHPYLKTINSDYFNTTLSKKVFQLPLLEITEIKIKQEFILISLQINLLAYDNGSINKSFREGFSISIQNDKYFNVLKTQMEKQQLSDSLLPTPHS